MSMDLTVTANTELPASETSGNDMAPSGVNAMKQPSPASRLVHFKKEMLEQSRIKQEDAVLMCESLTEHATETENEAHTSVKHEFQSGSSEESEPQTYHYIDIPSDVIKVEGSQSQSFEGANNCGNSMVLSQNQQTPGRTAGLVLMDTAHGQQMLFLPLHSVQGSACLIPPTAEVTVNHGGHAALVTKGNQRSKRGSSSSKNSGDVSVETGGTSTSSDPALGPCHECKWDECQQVFSSLHELVNHINDMHIKPECFSEVYRCHWLNCPRNGKGFNARYKILIHVRMHTNEKPHHCHQCNKSFSRLENLKIHTRTHTGERPYVCPYKDCNKAYSNSSDRFKHTLTHSTEKPYSCKVPHCNKRYTDPSSLRKHVRTHGHYQAVRQTVEESTRPIDITFASVDGEEVAAGVTVSSSVNPVVFCLSSTSSSNHEDISNGSTEDPYSLLANPLLSAATTTSISQGTSTTKSQGLNSEAETLVNDNVNEAESPTSVITALPTVSDGSKMMLLSSSELSGASTPSIPDVVECSLPSFIIPSTSATSPAICVNTNSKNAELSLASNTLSVNPVSPQPQTNCYTCISLDTGNENSN